MLTHSSRFIRSLSRTALAIVLLAGLLCSNRLHAAEQWTDFSGPLLARLTNSGAKLAWPGGCSGVVVNRTNGDVTVKVVGLGLWRSSYRGGDWHRLDGESVTGRDETGWATSVDADAPDRMVSFSLDGLAGWTADGRAWKSFTNFGRNWDYGSVDWSAPNPKEIIVARHETTPPGEVYASSDAGMTWNQLPIHLQESRGRVSMVGALGARALIYAKGDGIHRSTNHGLTWVKVSEANPQTRIPVRFRGVHYLGGTNGLLVSKDQGLTWRTQGSPVNIWQGPFFGQDAQHLLVIGSEGVFLTSDAGTTWRKAADLKPKQAGFLFTPNWFGCYAWDPIHNFLYASSMGNPVYRLEL